MRFNVFLFACLIAISCQPKISMPSPDADNGGLILPDGFVVSVVADNIRGARHLAIRENGDIYVKLRSSKENAGNVALRDTDGDGKADVVERFGGSPTETRSYGTGMTIHDGYLYYSSALCVYRQKLTRGSLVPTSPIEEVLIDDHEHGVHWHITKPVSFDKKGNMYVPFGGPTNACQDLAADPNGMIGGVGLDPCPELELHGGIWKFPEDRIGLKQSDGIKIATGIRSVVGMDWNNADDHLYLMMHGRDNLHSLFPNHFSPWQSAVLPSEEFIKIEEGGDYGWPYCYYDHMQGKKVLGPEYGGDGNMVGRCEDMDQPVMGFPGHWAPNDLMFYEGEQFPKRYKNGAFIAFHGSTNRAPYPQSGYFVGFVPFENGSPTGEWEVFSDGFIGVETVVSTSEAKFRPVGLAEGPDGSLYIIDSNKGKLWRVMFQGDKETFGTEELAGMESRKMNSHIRNPDPMLDDLQKDISSGERLYMTFCGTCHQRNGQGVNSRFPTLAGTDWVNGEESRLINLVLKGIQGPIVVNEEVFNGVMPGHEVLSDDDIAIILTYVRTSFGNNTPVINAEDVKRVRAAL